MGIYKFVAMVDKAIVGTGTASLAEIVELATPERDLPEGEYAKAERSFLSFVDQLSRFERAVLVDSYRVFEWDERETETVLTAWKV